MGTLVPPNSGLKSLLQTLVRLRFVVGTSVPTNSGLKSLLRTYVKIRLELDIILNGAIINQVLSIQKQPELGLVCITASDAVRFRTVTRKRLLQLTEIEQEKVLRELYADNLKRLDKAIDFCYANKIKLYRMTSALFPFADTDLGETVLALP